MSIKKHIPNIITLANLACGCIAIVMAFWGNLKMATYLIWIAMGFDFFDGLTARLLNVKSAIGKELDSLADMVSFGVVPSVIIFHLIGESKPIAFTAFFIALFSALRLAKFNIDESQETDFIGLPTPANALFISSLVFLKEVPFFSAWLDSVALSIIAIVFAVMLVMPVRLFSLKVSSLSWKGNEIKLIFLGLSIAGLILYQFVALPFIILLYILLSLVNNKAFRPKPQ